MWREGHAIEAWVHVERGRIVDEGTGRPAKAQSAILLDGVHDYHTHVGDAFLRGRRLPHSLDRLVRPPSGLKHRMLASAKPATIVTGIRRALQEYAERGTQEIVDFREQGLAGVRLARQASASLGPKAPRLRLLGRPATADEGELDQLLSSADGIGISAFRDTDPAALEEASRACRRARRPFAIHVSESRREPMDDVLALQPDLLVHLVKATPADLRRVRDAGPAVAVCPSSNAFFRLRSPVAALHAADVPFHFGTDNAMLGNRDLVQEAARAHDLAPHVPDAVLLSALTRRPEKVIKRLGEVAGDPNRAPRRVVILGERNGRVRWGQPPRVVAR
jgi:cytosine/adenosine deaminase-related metal-dependent hydrolase